MVTSRPFTHLFLPFFVTNKISPIISFNVSTINLSNLKLKLNVQKKILALDPLQGDVFMEHLNLKLYGKIDK
jgi:hypothetical protein